MRKDPGTVLMLQGPPCRFWRELGSGFRAAGRRAHHIGFSLADRLWWRMPGGRMYRGQLDDWPAHLAATIAREGVSDILYYADRLPYHRAAIAVARQTGVRAWTIENGYLRPDWITLEPEAMGAYSRFTRNAAEIVAAASALEAPSAAPRYRHGFAREAASEVAYNLTMFAGRPAFPNYVSDKPYAPPVDYLGWMGKWLLGGGARRAADRAEAMVRDGRRFFLLALQLESDYQIRASSRYPSLRDMLAEVIGSFAQSAPADAALIVKQHPMDNGLEGWPRVVRQTAARHGVPDRVRLVDGGSLDMFLAGTEGLVTVNSTVGLQALRLGRPVIALGDAVYDIPGLTHRAGLSKFWSAPEGPSRSLMQAYLAVLAERIQVRGSFYDKAGRQAAVSEIVRRVGQPRTYWRLDRPLTELGPGASDHAGTQSASTHLIAAE